MDRRDLLKGVAAGGLGEDVSDLPVVGLAPEYMSEKAIAIGMYFVASGIHVVIGQPLPVENDTALALYELLATGETTLTSNASQQMFTNRRFTPVV